MPLPTEEELFGPATAKPLPTEEELFGSVGTTAMPGMLSAMFGLDPGIEQRITNAFYGSGARAFGDAPITSQGPFEIPPELEQRLRKAGVWNDYEKGQRDFAAEQRERVWKATGATLATTIRAGAAALAAPLGAFGQALEEAGILGLIERVQGIETSPEDIEGAATDPGLAMLFPPAGFEGASLRWAANARRAANLKVEIPTWRAKAVIGEGNEGFYEVKPLTPENAAARVEAAKEAGIPTPLPDPVPPTRDVVARRIDPPTFEQYDALAEAKVAHRQRIQVLSVERENLPEAVQAREEIETILGKVHGVEERLTGKARARLEAAMERLDRALSTDTPEMAKTRKALMSADEAQRDLAPAVTSAYRQADELMPVEPQVVETLEEVSAGKPPEDIGLAPKQPTVSEAQIAERVEPPQQPHAASRFGEITGERPGPIRTTTQLRAIEGTGERKTLTVSEKVEARAIEQGFVEQFGDLPEYAVGRHDPQFEVVAQVVADDYERAKRIAFGQEAPPKGVHPEAFFVGVERAAEAAGDAETLRRLALESTLPKAGKTMGQRIRIYGERSQTSPVGKIQEVQAARQRALDAKNALAFKEAEKEIKAVMRRSAPKRDAWVSFIAEIRCQ